MFFTNPAKAADLPLQEYGNLFDDSAAILQKSSSKIMQLATNSEFETTCLAKIASVRTSDVPAGTA